jgi:hypothetical protein
VPKGRIMQTARVGWRPRGRGLWHDARMARV